MQQIEANRQMTKDKGVGKNGESYFFKKNSNRVKKKWI